MSSVNIDRESETADYLNAIRKHIAENKAGDTSGSDFTPEFILQFINQINLSNTVTLNNNKHEFSNQIDISNQMYLREVLKGAYRIGADNNDIYLNGKRFNGTGSSNPVIVKRASLQPTSAITLAVRAKLAAFTGTRRELIHNVSGNTGYGVYAEASANNVVVEYYDGAALISSQTFAFTADTWFTLVAAFQSGNQDLYKDGSLADSDTVAATISASSVDIGYGGTAAGATRIQSSDVLEQLVIIDRYVNSTWASRFNGFQADLTNAGDNIAAVANFCVAVA